jgi:hypothetical protein
MEQEIGTIGSALGAHRFTCFQDAKGTTMPTKYRERPLCRKVITSRGFRPEFDDLGRWNGWRAIRPDGSIIWITEGLRIEMKKMLQEGFWERPEATLADGCGPDFRSGSQRAERASKSPPR